MAANASANASETTTVGSIVNDVPKWTEIFVVVFMSVVTLSGVPGNGIILIVQWRNRDKSSTDVLVSTMAVFELLCAGFNSVFTMFRNIQDIWVEIASNTICSVHIYTQYITSTSSTLLLTAIALDRYFHTCKPLNTFCSKKQANRISVCIITASFLISLPGLFISTLDNNRLTCGRASSKSFLPHVLDLCLGIAFLTMFIVVVFCYAKVALLIQRRHRKKRDAYRFALADHSKDLRKSVQTSSKLRNINRLRSTKNAIHPQTSDENSTNVSVFENKSIQNQQEAVLEDKNNENPNETDAKSGAKPFAEIHKEQGKMVHRTTLIMFLITTIYITSWSLHWLSLAFVSTATFEGRIMMVLTKDLHMINCVTNPIFFITLSSKFRKKAKAFLCRRM